MNTGKPARADPRLTPKRPRALTNRFVETVKPAADHRLTFRDSFCPGLELRVAPSGQKTFTMRLQDGQRQRRLSWPWPSYSLAAAREAALEARRTHDKGLPVLTAKQRAAVGADGRGSVNWLLDRYVLKHCPKLRDGDEVAKAIDRHIRPNIGTLSLATVSKQDIRTMIAVVEQRGPIIALQMLRRARAVFRWGMIEDLCERDPSFGIRDPHKSQPRSRTLSDRELAAVWRAAPALGYPSGTFVRFLILSGCRNAEAREAVWPEFDLARADWLIPPARFKGKREHLTPLTDRMLDMLETMPYRERNLFVFSARGAGAKALVNPYKAKVSLDAASGVSDWTYHDLRRAMRSGMSRLGVPPHIAERCIGHADSKLGKIYDCYDYRSEKLEAFTLWDRHVASLSTADKLGR